ncbi:MAG: hypothetical protein E7044_02670 [Lentisphaerae bacterium]|nr:hypothetical protein [Lentisphaerota bacterium]
MKNCFVLICLLSAVFLSAAELSLPARFTEFHADPGVKDRYRTEAEVKLEGKFLVFTVKCFQPRKTVKAVAKLHDRDVYMDDCVEIYIDTAGKGRNYQQYIINSLGTLQDLCFRRKNWDSAGKAAGKIFDDHWIAVLKVPLSELAADNPVSGKDVCVNINICRSVQGKYGESLLADGSYGATPGKFIPIRLNGVSPGLMRREYLSMLKSKKVETSKIEKLSGAKFYAAAEEALEKQLRKDHKFLPDGVAYYFATATNVLPNPEFKYMNRRGEPANWLKKGEGKAQLVNGVLELSSGGKMELWQANNPLMDNKRVYALRARIRPVSGKSYFKLNFTGVDRSIKRLGAEKSVKELTTPILKNNGIWQNFEYQFELPVSAFRVEAGIIVENGSVQIRNVELDMLGKDYAEIIINQLGYHPKGYKDAIVWSRQKGLKPQFEILQNNKVVYRGKAVRKGTFYNREAWIADFSDFRREGTYTLRSNGMTTRPFKISRNIYMDGMRFLLNGYYCQRQGFVQKGWKKKADYADDAYIVSSKYRHSSKIYLPDGRIDPKYILGHKDLSGGWRDAGDCSKQGSDGESIYMLGRILYRLNPQWNLRKGKMADLPDELWWGCSRWVEKCFMPDGTFLDPTVNQTPRSPWIGIAPDEVTDGIPGTADDRVVFGEETKDGKFTGDLGNQWRHEHPIALVGMGMKKINPAISASCLRVMEKYYPNHVHRYFNVWKLDRKKIWTRQEMTRSGAKLAYTAIYLHQLTGKKAYKEMADKVMEKIIHNALAMNYKTYDKTSSFHATVHYFNVMLEYAEFYPDSHFSGRLKKAIDTYVSRMILPGYDLEALFPAFTSYRLNKHYGRTLPENAKGIFYYNSLCTLTLLRAGEILGNQKYVTLAEKVIQFWTGRNPQNMCEISGMGWRFSALQTGLSNCPGHEDGIIPGIMANGFRIHSFMPMSAKPSAVKPGGIVNNAFGAEAWIVPNGMLMGLMADVELILRRTK